MKKFLSGFLLIFSLYGQVSIIPPNLSYSSGDRYFLYQPIPDASVASSTFSRFKLTGASSPTAEYFDSNYTADLDIRRTVTAPSATVTNGVSHTVTGQLISMSFIPSANWNNSPTLAAWGVGSTIGTVIPASSTNAMEGLTGILSETYNRGSGAVTTQRGAYVSSLVTGSGNVSFVNDGLNITAHHYGTGTVANARGLVVSAGPYDTTPGATTSLAVIRGFAQTWDSITTAYGYRMTREGAVNPTTAWGISEETGWPSRFNSRVIVNSLSDNGSSALQVNGRINITLSTPASSTATCVTGDITADTSYLYICTSTNNWKRVALGSF